MLFSSSYFTDLAKAKLTTKPIIAVTCPYEEYTISALEQVLTLGFADVILVGEKARILEFFTPEHKLIKEARIVEASSDYEAAVATMKLLQNKEASILMKGLIDTSVILKELLNKEYDLKSGKPISHVTVTYSPTNDRYFIVSDSAMNIKPDLMQKKAIIQNAVDFAHKLGMEKPYVANLCAKEKPYDKMPDTIDAVALKEMNERNEITGCIVSGPLQLDTAVDNSSAELKSTSDPVAGKANILICPTIEAANIFTKALVYLSDWRFCGVLLGTKVPMVLTSRSSKTEERLVSISLACLAL
ncbi:MAG: phosphate acyltransferase [Mycoplasma sp.]